LPSKHFAFLICRVAFLECVIYKQLVVYRCTAISENHFEFINNGRHVGIDAKDALSRLTDLELGLSEGPKEPTRPPQYTADEHDLACDLNGLGETEQAHNYNKVNACTESDAQHDSHEARIIG
jgi:hypothetical protein